MLQLRRGWSVVLLFGKEKGRCSVEEKNLADHSRKERKKEPKLFTSRSFLGEGRERKREVHFASNASKKEGDALDSRSRKLDRRRFKRERMFEVGTIWRKKKVSYG